MKTYLLKNSDGTVRIMKILAEGVDVEDEIARLQDGASIVSYREIDESEIPADRAYREAWVDDPKKGLIVSPEKKTAVDVKIMRQNRAEEYPPIGDQLDAIMKWLDTETEVSIPAELKAVAMKCMSVKAKYPKPAGAE